MTVLWEPDYSKVRQGLEESVSGMIKEGKMEEGKEAIFFLVSDSYLFQYPRMEISKPN